MYPDSVISIAVEGSLIEQLTEADIGISRSVICNLGDTSPDRSGILNEISVSGEQMVPMKVLTDK